MYFPKGDQKYCQCDRLISEKVRIQNIQKRQLFTLIIKIIDKLQQMSREKSFKSKNYSVQLRQNCDQLFSNLKRQNSINSYLKKTARRDSHHHFRQLKNVTDSYMCDSGFNSVQKQNRQDGISSINFRGNLEKKIQDIIEDKLSKFLDVYIQKYVNKILEEHKTGLELYYRAYMVQIQMKLGKAEEGYTQMINNYDSFLKIVDSIKEKNKRSEKYIPKSDYQEQIKKIVKQIESIKDKVNTLNKDQCHLIKSNLNTIETNSPKIQPILLNSCQKWGIDLNRQELRVVVETFNENFIRIDEKLKEIACYMS